MLGLLLLQVLASCLCLGHSEVVKTFKTACTKFFYEKTLPSDILRPRNAARICQVYDNQYRFATLYDKTRRIPVYSAYIYRPGNGERYESWFVEPQLIKKKYRKAMDTEDSIIETYGITSEDIGENQAIDKDYSGATGFDRGHLCPSHHQSDYNGRWATFTLTNIVPQNSTLNQNAWRIYEEETMAEKTRGCDTTYVITGAVPGNTNISNGRVNVPSHIWSAACCLEGTNPTRAWGAIADNDKNEVKELNLERLENKLSELYGGRDVTLFNKACPRRKASHP
ncbi:endonuclease domain-containing 1 protein-like [Oenanthe melanoleuca]|uniref:endonuclease domain-containing 1 protein-like n=1 Tax=Oenanthe melanoleuca TaxID=2939378 RepID=UPI0024C17257|nr:endonuclease domain-containing 1 protein-like [Oenanthe melanoleuca]